MEKNNLDHKETRVAQEIIFTQEELIRPGAVAATTIIPEEFKKTEEENRKHYHVSMML